MKHFEKLQNCHNFLKISNISQISKKIAIIAIDFTNFKKLPEFQKFSNCKNWPNFTNFLKLKKKLPKIAQNPYTNEFVKISYICTLFVKNFIYLHSICKNFIYLHSIWKNSRGHGLNRISVLLRMSRHEFEKLLGLIPKKTLILTQIKRNM